MAGDRLTVNIVFVLGFMNHRREWMILKGVRLSASRRISRLALSPETVPRQQSWKYG